jgi:hypothetical protein
MRRRRRREKEKVTAVCPQARGRVVAERIRPPDNTDRRRETQREAQ